MEKLKKLGGKNIYIAIAATSVWFIGLWIYTKILKPIVIQREVTKLIERFEKENAESSDK